MPVGDKLNCICELDRTENVCRAIEQECPANESVVVTDCTGVRRLAEGIYSVWRADLDPL